MAFLTVKGTEASCLDTPYVSIMATYNIPIMRAMPDRIMLMIHAAKTITQAYPESGFSSRMAMFATVDTRALKYLSSYSYKSSDKTESKRKRFLNKTINIRDKIINANI